MSLSFDKFKESFYSRVKDMHTFDCLDFNALKIVLDGLKVNYSEKGIRDTTIFQFPWQLRLRLFLQRMRQAKHYLKAKEISRSLKQKKATYLLFDNGRTAYDSGSRHVSFYFERIRQELGDQAVSVIYQKPVVFKDAPGVQDLEALKYTDLDAEDLTLKAALKNLYDHIVTKKYFSSAELGNIATAFGIFFSQYRIWKQILSETTLKACLFDQHYHREGMLLALKRLGIRSIELQHGLIAKEDIFYVFPKPVEFIAGRALFPDKIFTYSPYWSGILNSGYEFRKEQVEVLGQYQYINTYISREQENAFYEFIAERPFILVTTQTFLHEHFIRYILWLSADLELRYAGYVIVVKLHPSEKSQDYEPILNLKNVKVLDCNTEFLLSKCTHHVSVYSTTLYDGSKYACQNYSLDLDLCSDYVQALVNAGVSELLGYDENPLDKPRIKLNRASFYEDFELHKHKLRAF